MRVRTAWERFQLGTGDDGAELGVRTEILTSWRRSRLSGVDPTGLDVPWSDVDDDSRFVRAARPVLDDCASAMLDTGLCLALTDPAGRVLWSWGPDRRRRRRLDELALLPGFRFDEEHAGTNGLGTALEAGHVVTVEGEEHFREVFHGFSCVAAPVRDPFTGRTLGAVDITGTPAEVHPLLRHTVLTMVRDIGRELAAAASGAERGLLEAFLAEPARRDSPVLTVDAGTLITNELGAGVTVDHRLLREVTATASDGERVVLPGLDRTAVVRHVPGRGPGAAVLVVDPERDRCGAGPSRPPVASAVERAVTASGAVVLRGEPGTGKRTLLRDVLRGGGAVVEIDAAEVDEEVERLARLAGGTAPVVLARVDRLAPAAAERVAEAVRSVRPGRTVAATWDAPEDRPPDSLSALLDAVGGPVVEMPALRRRPDELPELVRALAGRAADPAAVGVLQHHDWPGNLVELAQVVRSAAAGAGPGPIRAADLPVYVRVGRLTPLERAERAAVVDALAATHGNKTEAARRLGITRPTLYARLRAYRL